MNVCFAHSKIILLVTAVWILCASQNTAAQTHPQLPPSYTVATIKPADPNRSENETEIGYDDGSFTFTADNMSLKDNIKFAYDLPLSPDQQVVNGPAWAGSLRFNIVAKAEADTIAQLQKLTEKQRDSQVERMVQQLLAERFQLKTHKETRVLPHYDLVLAKGGPKMALSKTVSASPGAELGAGFLRGTACPIDTLLEALQTSPEFGRRLIADKTGLTGSYDFYIKWTPDETGGIDPPSEDSGVKQDPATPSFFTAIQEQLGLKLIPARGPVSVIVIDHADMPTQN